MGNRKPREHNELFFKLIGIALIALGLSSIVYRVMTTSLLETHSYLINISPYVGNVPFTHLDNAVLDLATGISVAFDVFVVFLGYLVYVGDFWTRFMVKV